MAERGGEETRKLYVAYFAVPPNLAVKLDQVEVQADEIKKSLELLRGNHTVTPTETGIEVSSDIDRTGRKLLLANYNRKLQVHELKVVPANLDKLPAVITEDPEKLKDLAEPYGPQVGPYRAHIMRLLMIGYGHWNEGNYKALAQASQAGESSPPLRTKGRVGGSLRAVGWATEYSVERGDNNRYILTLNDKEQGVRQETWAELTPRFSLGTASFVVLGRVLNVGRVRPAAPAA